MSLQKNFGMKKMSRSAYFEQNSLWQVLIYKHLPQKLSQTINTDVLCQNKDNDAQKS